MDAFWAGAEEKAKALAKELEKFADRSPEIRAFLEELKKLWEGSAEEREVASRVVVKILASPVFDVILGFVPPEVSIPVRLLGIALREVLEHKPMEKCECRERERRGRKEERERRGRKEGRKRRRRKGG